MESLFAPVAAKDLQFLNRQLNPIKELNQTGPQMLSDVCEAVGVRTKSTTEVGNLNQESVKCADLGGPKAEKTMSLVPPLFQRVLSALIDEDEGKESYNSNEGATKIFQCINDYSHKDKEKCEVESKQADDGSSFLTSMNFPWTDQDDQNMLNSSLVPLMSSGNHQYQGLSLDDKLALELQSIGLNCEVMPLVDGGEEWIDKEIKGLERELYQQEAKVKNSLSKLKASIQSDPKLDKRSIEESAMDQLVQITYSSTVIRPKKSSRKRKFSVKKPASLDFVNRTLARCKQFENSGRSCFSEPYLQDRILNKPTSEISVGPHDCNGLMMSKEAQKNITNQDSGFMINKERQELPSKIGSSPSSEENEVLSIGHPGQVETGFSGLKQSLSNPSGLAATYDFTLTKGKTESPRDIASCASSNPNLTSKHCGIHSEKVVKDGDKNEDEVTVNSTSSGVNISEPKSKQKRTLSRIGMQELAKSEQLSSIKACDPKTNANSVPHSPPGAASQPLSEGTLLDDAELAKFLDSNFLDLERLLDFDDEGLLDDNDCAGLDVPMDNLSDIDFSFKGGLL